METVLFSHTIHTTPGSSESEIPIAKFVPEKWDEYSNMGMAGFLKTQ